MHKTDIDGVGVEKRCHIVAAYDETDNCCDSIDGQVGFWKIWHQYREKSWCCQSKGSRRILDKEMQWIQVQMAEIVKWT